MVGGCGARSARPLFFGLQFNPSRDFQDITPWHRGRVVYPLLTQKSGRRRRFVAKPQLNWDRRRIQRLNPAKNLGPLLLG